MVNNIRTTEVNKSPEVQREHMAQFITVLGRAAENGHIRYNDCQKTSEKTARRKLIQQLTPIGKVLTIESKIGLLEKLADYGLTKYKTYWLVISLGGLADKSADERRQDFATLDQASKRITGRPVASHLCENDVAFLARVVHLKKDQLF